MMHKIATSRSPEANLTTPPRRMMAMRNFMVSDSFRSKSLNAPHESDSAIGKRKSNVLGIFLSRGRKVFKCKSFHRLFCIEMLSLWQTQFIYVLFVVCHFTIKSIKLLKLNWHQYLVSCWFLAQRLVLVLASLRDSSWHWQLVHQVK